MHRSARDPDPFDHDTWPFRACPDCGHGDFMAESTGGRIIFTCLSCGSAWRWCLGYVVSVTATQTDEFTN